MIVCVFADRKGNAVHLIIIRKHYENIFRNNKKNKTHTADDKRKIQ